jgi:hypothetical protein
MGDTADITIRGVPLALAGWLTTVAQEAGMSRTRLIIGFLEEAKRRNWTAREAPPVVVE